MAKQHFYTRVPAKVSMFNKADGYDTFACSDGIKKECIDEIVSRICNIKIAKEENDVIRKGKLPPVYFGFTSKAGLHINSCLTFLPLDYTGERTSFLVHSLISDGEEKKGICEVPDKELLNPDSFVHSIRDFDLASFDSKPDGNFPEKDITLKQCLRPRDVYEKFDRDMIRRLIYSVITCCCGKGKSVYISVPGKLSACSDNVLNFLGGFFQILPYHLREKLPFVTFTTDTVRYPTFKIKGIPDNINDLPTVKSIILHMGTRISLGLQDDLVAAESFTVDFFLDLLRYDRNREEFIRFYADAVAKKPELANTNKKNLREMLLIFCVCSGLYDENKILYSDDVLLEFMTAYDRHRAVVSDEYRGRAFGCLCRYPRHHEPIPSKVFAKLVKMYPDEPAVSKHTAMKSVLDLIHTDAMREKLFAFLKSNYCSEDEETKCAVVSNLCRVYYGGFMRAQILAFFSEHYGEFTAEDKDTVFDRILLTLRTPAIRGQILEFIGKYYADFTPGQKDKFVTVFLEALNEGDALAADLCIVTETFFENESVEFVDNFLVRFYQSAENDIRSDEQKILHLVCSEDVGFFRKAIILKVFTDWSNRKVFDEYNEIIWQSDVAKAVENIVSVWRTVPDMKTPVAEAFYASVKDNFLKKYKRSGLFALIRSDRIIKDNSDAFGKSAAEFFNMFVEECLKPAIGDVIPDAYTVDGGLDILLKFAEDNPYIRNFEKFSSVKNYEDMIAALRNKDAQGFFTLCRDFPIPDSLKKLVTGFRKSSEFSVNCNAYAFVTVEICLAALRKNSPDFNGLFNGLKSTYSDSAEGSGDEFDIDCRSMQTLFDIVNKYISVFEDDVYMLGQASSLSPCIVNFITANKRKGEKWLHQSVKGDFADYNSKLLTYIDTAIKAVPNNGIFSKLFGKK